MPNALAAESSPYLRQHAENPVEWRPWGSEALSLAAELRRPLLVSIGYSSCHWCHVMERESFEDEQVAKLMNEHFVCVKVDREERPDVDAIYMDAVQAMTGQGGWPLNVFLTPEQLPFYGGTYFPPQPMRGMPSWTQVLEAIAAEWERRSGEISEGAQSLRERLAGGAALAASEREIDPSALESAVAALAESFDAVNGGFGGAPKFPQAPVLEFLLAEAALGDERAETMALRTLDAIVAGGIHDLVGGGFHRYAVDATWTVPHFEKMLYDNALLARACVRAYKLSGRRRLLSAGLDALSWMLREMRGPEGGFYSALDADSDGVEGAFYVWTVAELEQILGHDAASAIAWTGATPQGNFVDPHHPSPGLNVLRERPAESGAGRKAEPAGAAPQSGGGADAAQAEDRAYAPDAETRARIKAMLLARREATRTRPGLDEKRLAAWNALAISALAEAGALLSLGEDAALADGERFLVAARDCADLLLTRMRDTEGRLLRAFDGARARLPAYLEDHAYLLEALIALYEATYETRWLSAADELAKTAIARFADDERGGFFSTAEDAEPLIVRRKDIDDSPTPAGASSLALSLLRLHALTGEHEYETRAAGTIALLQDLAPRHPAAFGHILQAMRLLASPPLEVAIVGPDGPERRALERVVALRLRPTVVVAVGSGTAGADDASAAKVPEEAVPLLAGRSPLDGKPAAYVCRSFACERPVTTPQELAALLDAPCQQPRTEKRGPVI